MGFEEAVMVRNSTACAMEWSIELEKALRSKNPGRCIEAIYQIGQRLEQWSGEPESTMVVYNMFGLVPGEDRLFANTIFLRLADSFQLGNERTRVTIVRIFLSLLKHCRNKKKNKQMNGVLSKSRVQNHLELLKRVKSVFDSGDAESRALALVLFGCWADFAKDSAQIRYLVLSSLVSSNVLEVRASLFAAGCFSELADDFSSVVLEMLVNMVTCSEKESVVRLAAVRAFAKMGCTFSNANRAFKANKVHNEENRSKVAKDGIHLLSNIILKWMCIPFRAPKYLFKIRPCFGSELFVSSAGTSNLGGIFIPTGFHLSLNLCLQLKNVPPDLPVRLTKFYCILCCSQNPVSDRKNSRQMPQSFQPWEKDNMVEMNEKLFQYVTECTQKINHSKCARDTDIDNNGRTVNTFVQIEPNNRGQGFSNCLLDVSQFPVGTYRIKWHSCCIDSQGSYWSLLPLNAEPLFTVK